MPSAPILAFSRNPFPKLVQAYLNFVFLQPEPKPTIKNSWCLWILFFALKNCFNLLQLMPLGRLNSRERHEPSIVFETPYSGTCTLGISSYMSRAYLQILAINTCHWHPILYLRFFNFWNVLFFVNGYSG